MSLEEYSTRISLPVETLINSYDTQETVRINLNDYQDNEVLMKIKAALEKANNYGGTPYLRLGSSGITFESDVLTSYDDVDPTSVLWIPEKYFAGIVDSTGTLYELDNYRLNLLWNANEDGMGPHSGVSISGISPDGNVDSLTIINYINESVLTNTKYERGLYGQYDEVANSMISVSTGSGEEDASGYDYEFNWTTQQFSKVTS